MTNIHPTAIVSDDVKLADDVSIGPYSVLEGDIEVGAGSVIGAHVIINGHTILGKNNKIFSFAAIGMSASDKKYAGEDSNLIVGDNNTFREYSNVHRGTQAGGCLTQIGNNNHFLTLSHIAHDCKVGNDVVVSHSAGVGGHVELQDYCTVSGHTAVHQFCRIGSYSFLSMGAMLRQDVPPFIMAQGDPARAIGINTIGLQRADFDNESKTLIKQCLKLMYRSVRGYHTRLNLIKELADETGNGNVLKFYQFILESGRQFVSYARD